MQDRKELICLALCRELLVWTRCISNIYMTAKWKVEQAGPVSDTDLQLRRKDQVEHIYLGDDTDM